MVNPRSIPTERLVALHNQRIGTLGGVEDTVEAIYVAGYRAAYSAGYKAGEKARTPKPDPIPAPERARPIIAAIALYRGVPVADILGPSKAAEPASARFEVVWLLRQLDPPVAFPACAAAVGRVNHSSAIYAWRAVEARIAGRPALRDELLGLLAVRVRRAA